jgi:hypothetical protein
MTLRAYDPRARYLSNYVVESTANPLGRRPWNYKLSAYYRANFAVPNPNEVGVRIENPTVGLGASFNKPGGIAQARWATRDNFNAPLPVYGAPELLPRHYSQKLGLMIATDGTGGRWPSPTPYPIYYGQSSGQNLLTPAPVVQTTLPQPTLTPATAAPATAPVAISSSGAPMSTGTPATTTPTTGSGSSLADLYNQTVAWMKSNSLVNAVPNYVPVGLGVLALVMLTRGKGRR